MLSAVFFMSIIIHLASKWGIHIPRISWGAVLVVLLPVILLILDRKVVKLRQTIFGYSTYLFKIAVIAIGVLRIISLSCSFDLCRVKDWRWRDVASIPFIGTMWSSSTNQETNGLATPLIILMNFIPMLL